MKSIIGNVLLMTVKRLKPIETFQVGQSDVIPGLKLSENKYNVMTANVVHEPKFKLANISSSLTSASSTFAEITPKKSLKSKQYSALPPHIFDDSNEEPILLNIGIFLCVYGIALFTFICLRWNS